MWIIDPHVLHLPNLVKLPAQRSPPVGRMGLYVLEISSFFGDRWDAEMRDIYSALRRRPDGRSLGFVHDYMWQAAALLLAHGL